MKVGVALNMLQKEGRPDAAAFAGLPASASDGAAAPPCPAPAASSHRPEGSSSA